MKKEYLFKLPIGDWSDDGHGRCEWFEVTSDQPLEIVREKYLEARDKVGYSPEDPCSDAYDTVIKPDQIEKLGLDPKKYLLKGKADVPSYSMFAQLFVDYMAKHTNVTLSINQNLPMFPFYGIKEGKHISNMGYGLFE